jgi:thiol-disulfide isomerase/thioredoxin
MIPAVPPPVLEVYYSPTCAPCRLELPAVAEFVREDRRHVRIVILDQVTRAHAELQDISPQLAAAAISASNKKPREALRAAGDDDGMLPYARAVSPTGKTCAQWRGGLTLERARSLIATCAKAINAPNKRRS